MILAAGRGTRMGRLTDARPKPLLPVAGKPIIDHVLAHLLQAGVERVVVNLHHKGPQLRAHLAGRDGVEIAFSDEADALLDTGGGIANALSLLGDAPFYAVNGDVFWLDGEPPALDLLAARFDPTAMDALLLLQPTAAAVAYGGAGDFAMDAGGRLQRRGTQATAPYVFTGVQLLAPALFADAPDGAFSLNVLYDRAIASGRLHGVRNAGQWVEINTPQGLQAAQDVLAG